MSEKQTPAPQTSKRSRRSKSSAPSTKASGANKVPRRGSSKQKAREQPVVDEGEDVEDAEMMSDWFTEDEPQQAPSHGGDGDGSKAVTGQIRRQNSI